MKHRYEKKPMNTHIISPRVGVYRGPRWEGRRRTPTDTCVGRWGSCLPCRPQGSGPRPKPDHPTHKALRQFKSRFRHRPSRRTPTSPPAINKGQAPVRKCRLGNPPPLGPNGLVGRAPFVTPSGSWLALASSRRRSQTWGKPHKRGRPPPAMVTPSLATGNRRLPNPPSQALCGPHVVSVPSPLLQASTDRA